jgi:hypothetical protein
VSEKKYNKSYMVFCVIPSAEEQRIGWTLLIADEVNKSKKSP